MNPKDNVIQGPWPQWGVIDFDDPDNQPTQLDLDYWKWEELLHDEKQDAWNQFYELERQKELIRKQKEEINQHFSLPTLN